MTEQLFNPWDGKPETAWERLSREHTESWAVSIKPEMDTVTTWKEVLAFYQEHNAEITNLRLNYVG